MTSVMTDPTDIVRSTKTPRRGSHRPGHDTEGVASMQRESTRRAERTVFTYFIQAYHGGPVKIGIAADVDARLRDLQTSCPDVLKVVGTVDGNTERWFHRAWRRQRIRGEWFKPHEDMLEWAPALRLDDDRPPIDQMHVSREAFRDGWSRALEYVAAALPEHREEVFEAADDVLLNGTVDWFHPPLEVSCFEKPFALGSHGPDSTTSPGERDAR